MRGSSATSGKTAARPTAKTSAAKLSAVRPGRAKSARAISAVVGATAISSAERAVFRDDCRGWSLPAEAAAVWTSATPARA